MGYRSKKGNTYKSYSDMKQSHKMKQQAWAIRNRPKSKTKKEK